MSLNKEMIKTNAIPHTIKPNDGKCFKIKCDVFMTQQRTHDLTGLPMLRIVIPTSSPYPKPQGYEDFLRK